MLPHKKLNVVIVGLVLLLSWSIAFVSLSRTGLYQAKDKLTSREYRNKLIALKPVYADDGSETGAASYNLPEPGMLPNNPFYGFKALRDWLWIKFTLDPIEKAKLYQYMADKKLSEAVALVSDSKIKDGYIAVEESYGYLEETIKLLDALEAPKKAQATQYRQHAIDAGKAYAMIIGNFATSLTNSEYDRKQEWLGVFSNWNAKFEEEDN